jgi:hypothetical protein
LFENTVRIGFSIFKNKDIDAKDKFSEVSEGSQPENNRKHLLKEEYEIVFKTADDANKVFNKRIEFEGT